MPKYITRILPQEEWPRLRDTEAADTIPYLNPKFVEVLVIEKNHEIVGCWLFLTTYHAECVWIKPKERGNPVVANRLIHGIMQLGRVVGTPNIVTSALTQEIEDLITKHLNGQELPGKMFVFPVKG